MLAPERKRWTKDIREGKQGSFNGDPKSSIPGQAAQALRPENDFKISGPRNSDSKKLGVSCALRIELRSEQGQSNKPLGPTGHPFAHVGTRANGAAAAQRRRYAGEYTYQTTIAQPGDSKTHRLKLVLVQHASEDAHDVAGVGCRIATPAQLGGEIFRIEEAGADAAGALALFSDDCRPSIQRVD